MLSYCLNRENASVQKKIILLSKKSAAVMSNFYFPGTYSDRNIYH